MDPQETSATSDDSWFGIRPQQTIPVQNEHSRGRDFASYVGAHARSLRPRAQGVGIHWNTTERCMSELATNIATPGTVSIWGMAAPWRVL